MVDTTDLKSVGFAAVRVQVPPPPFFFAFWKFKIYIFNSIHFNFIVLDFTLFKIKKRKVIKVQFQALNEIFGALNP